MCERYAGLIAAIERGDKIKTIYNAGGEYDGFDVCTKRVREDRLPAHLRVLGHHRHRHHLGSKKPRYVEVTVKSK